MIWRRTLPCQISIIAGNPVPHQTENEPTEGKWGDEQKEDESPPDLHKGGPKVGQEGKVFAVHDVSKFNVAASIFGHQSGPVTSPFC